MTNRDYLAFELIFFAIVFFVAIVGTSSCGSLPPASQVDSMFNTKIEESGMYLKSVDTKMFQSVVYVFAGSIDNRDHGAFALSKQDDVIEQTMIPTGEHWQVIQEISVEISGCPSKLTFVQMGSFPEDETATESCVDASNVLVTTQNTYGFYGLWLDAEIPDICDSDALEKLIEDRIIPFFDTYVFNHHDD